MILKSLSRKTNGRQLIRYVLRYVSNEEKCLQQETAADAQTSPLIITHNLRSKTIQGYIKEFAHNEQFRLVKRSDSVLLYHTILSFGAEDKEHISKELLTDIAHKFIELRGKENLFVITSHHNKEHAHLHAVSSGVQTNGRSSRISKQ